jgi:hypothetical protein
MMHPALARAYGRWTRVGLGPGAAPQATVARPGGSAIYISPIAMVLRWMGHQSVGGGLGKAVERDVGGTTP